VSNVSDIREARSVQRQASEWLVLLESGDATADDRARFEAWLADHPGHRAAYTELMETWGRLHAMGDRLRTRRGHERAPDAVPSPVARTRPGRKLRRRAVWAAAAGILMAMVGGLVFNPSDPPPVYATDVGERSTVSLPDGTTVELNTDTAMLVDYSENSRTVILQHGEAYFDVARDETRPFVVQAGHGAIRAVGTGFVVRMKSPDVVAVTVTEGVVEVTHDAGKDVVRPADTPARPQPKLHKGERAEYDRQATRIEVIPPQELERAHAWRRGLLIFDGQPLEQVIREVSRYTDTRLILSDAELGEVRIGGAFEAGDVEALLEVLEKGFGIVIRREGTHTVYLQAASAVEAG
jgi:transmembrane sensor